MKLLLYCTKAKPYLVQGVAKPMHTLDATNPFNFNWKLVNKGFFNDRLNGKIVAECDFEVEEIEKFYCCGDIIQTKTMTYEALLGRSCLTDDEFKEYNPTKAIHIKNLHIFDEPRELSDYYKYINKPIINAPQNMMKAFGIKEYSRRYVENGYVYEVRGDDITDYVLISIQPEWLCKILNGEKTIEVRKKVLKEMLV